MQLCRKCDIYLCITSRPPYAPGNLKKQEQQKKAPPARCLLLLSAFLFWCLVFFRLCSLLVCRTGCRCLQRLRIQFTGHHWCTGPHRVDTTPPSSKLGSQQPIANSPGCKLSIEIDAQWKHVETNNVTRDPGTLSVPPSVRSGKGKAEKRQVKTKQSPTVGKPSAERREMYAVNQFVISHVKGGQSEQKLPIAWGY